MRVELDLDATQLELLDKNLKDCLVSLTKEQQVELLQNYINTQLEGFRKVKDRIGYWNSTEYEYTDFGKQLIDTLRDNIEESVIKSIMGREDIETLIQEKITQVSANIENIIEKAITKFILERLLIGKDGLESEIRNTINQMR